MTHRLIASVRETESVQRLTKAAIALCRKKSQIFHRTEYFVQELADQAKSIASVTQMKLVELKDPKAYEFFASTGESERQNLRPLEILMYLFQYHSREK